MLNDAEIVHLVQFLAKEEHCWTKSTLTCDFCDWVKVQVVLDFTYTVRNEGVTSYLVLMSMD